MDYRTEETNAVANIVVDTLNSAAKIEITPHSGTTTLIEGDNLFTIKVTSANGEVTKEYILNVYYKILTTETLKNNEALARGANWSWTNNTGYDVTITYSIRNVFVGDASESGTYCYTYLQIAGSTKVTVNPNTTKTGTITLPAGKKLTIQNQSNVQGVITIKTTY